MEEVFLEDSDLGRRNREDAIEENYGLKGDAGGLGPLGRVNRDIRREIIQACSIAHFGGLTVRMFGFAYLTPSWVSSLQSLQTELSPFTSFIDAREMKHWFSDDELLFVRDSIAYATTAFQPAFQCKEGDEWPFGFDRVSDFRGSAGAVANPPPDQTPAGAPIFSTIAPCSGSDCDLVPRSYIVRLVRASSRVTVQASSGGNSDVTATAADGELAIRTSSCEREASGRIDCTGHLQSLDLYLDGLSLFGETVSFLRVWTGPNAGTTPVVIQGGTIFIPNLTATAQVHLADGTFDVMNIESGALLGTWDATAGSLLAAIAFEGSLGSGIQGRIDGTVGGVFENTSPIAIALAASEAPSVAAGFECTSPAGAPVELSAEQVIDPDGHPLRYRWTSSSGDFVSDAEIVALGTVPIGDHEFRLDVFDHRGQSDSAALRFSVVDRTPPALDILAPACISPAPNHQSVRIALGRELVARSVDLCGPATTRIVGVVSDQPEDAIGDGGFAPDAVFTDTQACIRLERNAILGDRAYTFTIESVDESGNVALEEVRIRIPMSPDDNCEPWKGFEQCEL